MHLFLHRFALKATSHLGREIAHFLTPARRAGLLWAWLLIAVVWAGLGHLSAQAQSPTIRYVSPQGAGSQTGTSWTNALPGTSLQTAINASSVSDQVWVAGGQYKPGGPANTNRAVSFAMKEGVAIYGGFVGTETSLDQRPTSNPVAGSGSGGAALPVSSTLSGDIGRVGDNTDNSLHVIYNPAPLTNTAILDGFVITGGNADSSSSSYSSGGGIYNNGNGSVCSPQIRHCAFIANSAVGLGGAMFNDGRNKGSSNPVLTNCAFLSNASTYDGGAVYNTGQLGISSPTLINCAFIANTAAHYGGAMVNEGTNGVSSPYLLNCTFLANVGGAMYNSGFGGNSSPRLTNCVLFGNGGTDTFHNGDGVSVTASYSLFDNTVTGYTDGGNNRTTTTSPFASLTSVALNACGPAINAGSNQAYTDAGGPQTDLVGNPRIYPTGGRIDMGAVESQETAQPIAFIQQPPSTSAVCIGSRVEIPVRVTGSVLAYQWYKDDQPVSGQTSATLTLNDVQAEDGGRYSVEVTGGCSSLTSTAFSLAVGVGIAYCPPTLSASPDPVVTGQPITFLINLGNVTGSYTYTLTNGTGSQTTGTTSSSVFSQTLTANGIGSQTYSLTVTNGAATGKASTSLTVLPRTIFITNLGVSPDPVVAGKPITFTATIDSQSQPYSYSLTNGRGSIITGTVSNAAFNQTLLARGTGPQTYTLIVASGDARGSSTVALTVNPGPPIADGPVCTDFINRTTKNAGLGADGVNGVYAVGNTIFAATNNGLSISTNGGTQFYTRHTGQGLGSDHVNGVYGQGDRVYAATDNGLSVSSDGGQTFINKTINQGLGSNGINAVYAIGQTVYAATNNGLSISTDGGQSFINYIQGLRGPVGNTQIQSVYVDVEDNIVYVANGGGGLSISTNGGLTFIDSSYPVEYSGDEIKEVYAQGSTVYLATGLGLRISTDGGQNFKLARLGRIGINGVYAQGNTVYAATENGLGISTDGGQSFTVYTPNNTYNGIGNPFIKDVYVTGNRIYVATEGGGGGLSICPTPAETLILTATPNPVISGQPITFVGTLASGLSGPHAYTLTNGLGSIRTGTIISSATFSQTLTARGVGPQTYTLTVGTESGRVSSTVALTVSPGSAMANGPVCTNFVNRTNANSALSNDNTMNVYAQGERVYVATGDGLNISTDSGRTFKTIGNGLANSIISKVYVQGNTVYAATYGGLGISTNGGESFTNKSFANGEENIVYDVFATGQTVYAATGGGLRILTNGETSFVTRTTQDGLGDNVVLGVYVVDNVVYAVTGAGLSISTDGGGSFINRTTQHGLGSNVVFGVYVVANVVYVATEGGLSISTDGGGSFINRTIQHGLGSNEIQGVFAQGNTVYAATRGGLSISTNGGQSFSNYTSRQGLGSGDVRSAYALGDRIYVATKGGVSFCSQSVMPPTITALSASPNPVQTGQAVTFTATVGGVSGSYSYTLSYGADRPLSGKATGASFNQRLTAQGSGVQTFTLTVATEEGKATAITSLSVLAPPVTLTSLAASPNPVITGQPVLFTATVGEVTGSYAYTLANGVDTPLSGTASSTTFSQRLTATGSGLQSYSLTVTAENGTATATTSLSVLVPSSGLSITEFRPNNQEPVTGKSVRFTATLTGLIESDNYSFTLTNGRSATPPLIARSLSAVFDQSVPLEGAGPQTYTLTVTSQKGNASATASIVVIPENVTLVRFAILGVMPVGCEVISAGERQVRFTPQYVGASGEPISFSVVNELAPTTTAGPYSLRLNTDKPTITLVASQGGRGAVRFIYNWLAACQGAPTPPQAPVSTGIPSQTLQQDQAYQLLLTDYFTDPDGQTPQFMIQGLPPGLNLSEGLISGTPSTTGTYPLSVTATDPGGLTASTSFTILVNPSIVGNSPLRASLASSFTSLLTTGTTTLSATVTGGTSPYSYSFTGPGTITSNGNTASVTGLSTGVQTFTLLITDAGSPTHQTVTATVSVTVTAPPAASLQVLYQDADYGNTGNAIIKPFLQLSNTGGEAIPYKELTLRYWLTAEGNAPPTDLVVYYAPLGAVNMKYVPLSQPRQGALGYIEYSFSTSGNLLGGGNSGPIENGIQKTDRSAFNELDDYSYQANSGTYKPNARITAYRQGADGQPVLIWGQEPTPVASQTAVAIYSAAKDGTTTSQIQTRLELRNTGNMALPVGALKLRYYFTSDNNQPASVFVDYADMGAARVAARVVKLPAPVEGADSYVELSFPNNTMQMNALSSLGVIDFRLVRSDNGLFNQINDYSYAANYGNVGLNAKVTAYLDNRLIFGTPPSGAPARLGASEPGTELAVKVLGNPVVGDQAQIIITGVAGQAVSLRLVDLQGHTIHEQRIQQAADTESVSLPLGQSRGQLLLKVSTESQQQSVKLMRP